MATWTEAALAAPELAAWVQDRFKAQRHALVATLRRDGSPRLSGIETQFVLGELWLGMMGGSRKAADLQRDPRMALHAGPDAPELPNGDAKIAGRAIEITDPATINAWSGAQTEAPPPPFHLFRVDVTELSFVRVEGDHLIVDWWREGEPPRRVERR